MANDYIIYKWRLWFRKIDINRRGKISIDDVKDEEEIVADLGHLDAKQKKEMQETLERIWNNVVFRGKTGSISEDEFVEMNKKLYAADKEKFFKELFEAYSTFFTDIVDVNHEGLVNEENFINMMRSIHHEDSGLNKKFFAMYNPVDGKIPLKDLIDSWVQFTTCDDSSKRDLVKEAIEAGINTQKWILPATNLNTAERSDDLSNNRHRQIRLDRLQRMRHIPYFSTILVLVGVAINYLNTLSSDRTVSRDKKKDFVAEKKKNTSGQGRLLQKDAYFSSYMETREMMQSENELKSDRKTLKEAIQNRLLFEFDVTVDENTLDEEIENVFRTFGHEIIGNNKTTLNMKSSADEPLPLHAFVDYFAIQFASLNHNNSKDYVSIFQETSL